MIGLSGIQPLSGPPPAEVPLPNAPLARVIAQIRFPQILAIRNPDKVAGFQEAIRATYPILSEDRTHQIIVGPSGTPTVQEGKIWRFRDQDGKDGWRVSLGVDFIAIETSTYVSRKDFLRRFCEVVSGLETTFKPAEAQRLGLRYIDRLTDGAMERLTDLIQSKVLGIYSPDDGAPNGNLAGAASHVITEAQFIAEEGTIQSRWGTLPAETTYDPEAVELIKKPSFVLDLDMFTTTRHPFTTDRLTELVSKFAERIYSVFREMVTDDFLKFYGGDA